MAIPILNHSRCAKCDQLRITVGASSSDGKYFLVASICDTPSIPPNSFKISFKHDVGTSDFNLSPTCETVCAIYIKLSKHPHAYHIYLKKYIHGVSGPTLPGAGPSLRRWMRDVSYGVGDLNASNLECHSWKPLETFQILVKPCKIQRLKHHCNLH